MLILAFLPKSWSLLQGTALISSVGYYFPIIFQVDGDREYVSSSLAAAKVSPSTTEREVVKYVSQISILTHILFHTSTILYMHSHAQPRLQYTLITLENSMGNSECSCFIVPITTGCHLVTLLICKPSFLFKLRIGTTSICAVVVCRVE